MALDFPNAPTNGQTFTAPDGTVWTWDGVKWVVGSSASGLITAQQLDYDTLRLTAVGTKLKALGPLTSFNVQAAAVNTAVDGALNYCSNGANYEWDLPVPALGMCVGFYLSGGHPGTIRPSAGVVISAPGGIAYTNAAPLIVPAEPLVEASTMVLFCSRLPAWDILSVSPNVANAMGWVSPVPYLFAQYYGVDGSCPNSVWTKINMDAVFDSNGWWQAVNYRYAPARAGKYEITYRVTLGDKTTGQVSETNASIYLNGAQHAVVNSFTVSGLYLPAAVPLTLSTVVALNGVSDYIEPYCYIAAPSPWISGSAQATMIVKFLGQ